MLLVLLLLLYMRAAVLITADTTLHSHYCTITTATAAGADIAAVCTSVSCQRSILHYAALGGSAALIKALLSRGANAAALDSKNCLPLHCACAHGHLEVRVHIVMIVRMHS
jgi:ankyrin repeat protein